MGGGAQESTFAACDYANPKLITMNYNYKLGVQDEKAWLNVGCTESRNPEETF